MPRKVKNVAKPEFLTEKEVIKMIDDRMFNETNVNDYYQLKHRFSQRSQGLHNGAPPPRVE